MRLAPGSCVMLACALAIGGSTIAGASPAGNDARATASPAPPPIGDFAQWVLTTHDNGGMPYVVIDKRSAQVFVFDARGHLQASAPALLGLARGDYSIPGVGDRKLSAIRPQERITPAGRFVASLGHDTHGQQILWIDYRDAIALHPVVKGTPQEHRAERLGSASSEDNRISYGCINVPRTFYDRYVSPAFAHTSGVVYILPDLPTTRGLFGSYDPPTGPAPKPGT